MKRYIDNPTAAVMFVAGVMIPPGEGREVEEIGLPPELQTEPQGWADTQPTGEVDMDAQLLELLKQPLKDLVPQLDAMTTEQLVTLAALENQAAAPRVTLLQKITTLQLDRAAAAANGGQAGTGDGTGTGEGTGAVDGAEQPQA